MLLLLLLFTINSITTAGGITIEEAIILGLKNNSELQKTAEKIKTLQRELALIKAGEDWQMKLTTDYSYPLSNQNNLALNVSKSYSSGLRINSGITVREDALSTPDYSIALIQRIYPLIPLSSMQQYYTIEQELLKAEEKLSQEKSTKIVNWLESYLSLVRLLEKREIYQENRELQLENLAKIMAKYDIGDVGAGEIYSAQIRLEEAEYRLKEAELNLVERKLSLYRALGLASEQELIIDSQADLIAELSYLPEPLKKEELLISEFMTVIEQNNYQLISNRIDQALLQQELEWLEKEAGLTLNMESNYASIKEELTLALKLSYQFYDGGQHRLKSEAKKREIELKKVDYQDLMTQLEGELRQLINQVELSQARLRQEELKVAERIYREKTAWEQYQLGLIKKSEYQEFSLQQKEAENNLQVFQDQFLIDKIELSAFIENDNLLGGFDHE